MLELFLNVLEVVGSFQKLWTPYGMHLKEYREMKQMEKIKQARLERELEERKKEAELRKKKPHLFNVLKNIHVIRTGSMSLITKCSRNGVKHNEHNQ